MGVAQSVAAWRERPCREIDQPVRFVLPDLALVGIAQRPPADVDGAAQGAAASTSATCGAPVADELLAAVAEGLELPSPLC